MMYKAKFKKVKNVSVSIKCPRCHGIGSVVFVSLLNKLSGYKKAKCHKCMGTGIAPK